MKGERGEGGNTCLVVEEGLYEGLSSTGSSAGLAFI